MTDELIAALNAERYGPSLWWKHDQIDPAVEDSEGACARRRQALADEYDRVARGGAA